MNDRPTHAPCFARSHDDVEPSVVGGFGLGDTAQRRTFDLDTLPVPGGLDDSPRYRPKPQPSYTTREGHAKGCGPEALGVLAQ